MEYGHGILHDQGLLQLAALISSHLQESTVEEATVSKESRCPEGILLRILHPQIGILPEVRRPVVHQPCADLEQGGEEMAAEERRKS